MTIQVYADVLFLINFCMDYSILHICKKLLGNNTRQWRLIAAAAIGGIYSTCVFFPNLHILYTLASKLCVSLLMVFLSFPSKKIKTILFRTGMFYLVNFLFGGACMALLYFTDTGGKTSAIVKNGAFYLQLPMRVLVISAAAAYAMISILGRWLKNRHGREMYDVTIFLDGKRAEAKGFVDTGNCLTEPMTNRPVIIAQWDVLKTLFPAECTKDNFVSYIAPERLKMIPYKSVGNHQGLLWAVRVDRVEFSQKKVSKALVGIYEGELSEDYSVLLHRGLMV